MMVDRRWAMTKAVRPCSRRASASWMICSVCVSMLEVASSRIRMRGSASSARAKEISWRWPDREDHAAFFDRGFVAQAHLADKLIRANGFRGGFDFCHRVASSRPKRMFSRTVPENRKGSCSTMPIWRRRLSWVTSRRSCPSTRIAPAGGVMEARQQLDDGGFARAGFAHQGHGFTRQECADRYLAAPAGHHPNNGRKHYRNAHRPGWAAARRHPGWSFTSTGALSRLRMRSPLAMVVIKPS